VYVTRLAISAIGAGMWTLLRRTLFRRLVRKRRSTSTLDTDADGDQLTGTHSYRVTFPAGGLPPVNGFWSLTMYNEAHFFYPNQLRRYSLGTKNKSLTYGSDGSLTLYVGASSPGADHEPNWLPAPDGDFSLYLRAYGGQQPITDSTWTPPAVTRE
jgi:hypothetical protein